MSLKPELEYKVPEQTASIARAAFPKSSLCMRIYDELGTIFQDQDFADIFSRRGQPAEAPFRLALVTILQFVEGLSDRAASDAVRGRIDWKYLLCLELDNPGFDYSVLSEFRSRLLDKGIEKKLLNKLLEVLCDKKLLKVRGKQRTDSTHILAAIRNLNRLERVGETLRAALNALAIVVPEWVQANVPLEWVERYGKRIEDYRLPEGDKERKSYAAIIGTDGDKLLDMLYAEQTLTWLREIPAVEILRLVWLYNYQTVNAKIELRDKDNIPPSSIHIDSPYDKDAHFGRKRNKTWVGCKVHITETCDKDSPEIIIDVQTEKSTKTDNDTIPEIHKSLPV